MARRARDSEGRFKSEGTFGSVKDNPWASAAIAAGAAAAGAFLWTRRGQIGDAVSSGMDSLSEMKSQRMRGSRDQSDIAEEAMTLKETGKRSKGPRGPLGQQEVKAGIASSNQEAKAGAKAYS